MRQPSLRLFVYFTSCVLLILRYGQVMFGRRKEGEIYKSCDLDLLPVPKVLQILGKTQKSKVGLTHFGDQRHRNSL